MVINFLVECKKDFCNLFLVAKCWQVPLRSSKRAGVCMRIKCANENFEKGKAREMSVENRSMITGDVAKNNEYVDLVVTSF